MFFIINTYLAEDQKKAYEYKKKINTHPYDHNKTHENQREQTLLVYFKPHSKFQ